MGNSSKTNVVAVDSCPGCDAEVRPHSEFCYNCGSSLRAAPEIAPAAAPPKKFSRQPENGSIKNGPGLSPVNERARGRPAGNARSRFTEPIQVIWQRDEGVGMSFILFSAGAAVFVILLIAIAYYLK